MNFTFVLLLQEKTVQKGHTAFQPWCKIDGLEISCELLHRGTLTLDLMVVVICRAHLAVLCMKRCPGNLWDP